VGSITTQQVATMPVHRALGLLSSSGPMSALCQARNESMLASCPVIDAVSCSSGAGSNAVERRAGLAGVGCHEIRHQFVFAPARGS
jgi:hypothetical protein